MTTTGSVWRATYKDPASMDSKRVVIKMTNRRLHSQSVSFVNGSEYRVQENIKTERNILKQLSADKRCPESIVKCIDFFKTYVP